MSHRTSSIQSIPVAIGIVLQSAAIAQIPYFPDFELTKGHRHIGLMNTDYDNQLYSALQVSGLTAGNSITAGYQGRIFKDKISLGLFGLADRYPDYSGQYLTLNLASRHQYDNGLILKVGVGYSQGFIREQLPIDVFCEDWDTCATKEIRGNEWTPAIGAAIIYKGFEVSANYSYRFGAESFYADIEEISPLYEYSNLYIMVSYQRKISEMLSVQGSIETVQEGGSTAQSMLRFIADGKFEFSGFVEVFNYYGIQFGYRHKNSIFRLFLGNPGFVAQGNPRILSSANYEFGWDKK